MKMVDYDGKLNNNKDYLNMLKKLQEKCEYIEVVIIWEGETNDLVEKFQKDIIERKKVSEWWATKTSAVNNFFKIKASDELFKYLEQFETFCKFYFYDDNIKSLIKGDYCENTDFGIDDIAFYDKDGNMLLGTTTHEGYISVCEDLVL